MMEYWVFQMEPLFRYLFGLEKDDFSQGITGWWVPEFFMSDEKTYHKKAHVHQERKKKTNEFLFANRSRRQI